MSLWKNNSIGINFGNNPITITSSEADQSLRPDAVSKPHWYQRIGFKG
ncbi:MAG: hypothetical protein WCW66_04650 [Patescibacteria group bacterium]